MTADAATGPVEPAPIEVGAERYVRIPIRTHVIDTSDDISEVVSRYAKPHLEPGDVLFVSERVVAITQGRAFPVKDIEPGPLARFLVRFVHKSPYGIGLGSNETMELAIREAGAGRILLASLAAAVTKPLGKRGVFYKVAGANVNAIDGPTSYTLPPYDEYAVLGPVDADGVARRLGAELGCEVVIIDANDLGVSVLGRSSLSISDEFCKQVFRDNPLGQSREQTPLGIVRSAP